MAATSKGSFVWHELSTIDIDGAKKFYPQITGWTIQDYGEGEDSYPMWVAGGAPIGGVTALPEMARQRGAPPHWLAYISTPDTDATTAEAVKLGGRVVHGPFDIPNIGRTAIVIDPQGAVFAPFTTSGNDMAKTGMAPVGEFSWHELGTSDFDAAWAYYSQLFGWQEKSREDMGGGMVYLTYGEGSDTYGGMYTIPKDNPMRPSWLHYVRVEDADEAAKKTEQLGGKIANGPMDVPGGDRIAQLIDPQGAFFAVHAKAK